MSTDHSTDVKRYAAKASDKHIDGIIKHLGIALKSKDAALVSCSSKDELARVRESWVKKKLGISGDDSELDAVIKEICEKMKGDKQKQRVTFYYLLAEHYGKLDALA